MIKALSWLLSPRKKAKFRAAINQARKHGYYHGVVLGTFRGFTQGVMAGRDAANAEFSRKIGNTV